MLRFGGFLGEVYGLSTEDGVEAATTPLELPTETETLGVEADDSSAALLGEVQSTRSGGDAGTDETADVLVADDEEDAMTTDIYGHPLDPEDVQWELRRRRRR